MSIIFGAVALAAFCGVLTCLAFWIIHKLFRIKEIMITYPTVAGKFDELHPKCRICLHLRPMPVIAQDYYGCGKAPLMYPDVCPWFTDASWKKYFQSK